MKKQILFKSLIVFFFVVGVSFFGFKANTVYGTACSLLPGSVSVTPTSGNIGDTVTINWSAQACDSVSIQINPNSGAPFSVTGLNAVGTVGYTRTLSGPPEQYVVTAIGTCRIDGDMMDGVVCGSQTVSVALSAPPPTPTLATVSVALGTCPANTTYSSSTGNSGTAPGSFTFTPDLNGTMVTMTGAVPDPTTWSFDGFSSPPNGSQMVYQGGTSSFTPKCTQINPPQPGQTPTVTLTVDGKTSTTITLGQSVSFVWSVPNFGTGTCTATGGTWAGQKASYGTESTMPALAQTYTYSIQCHDGDIYTNTASVSVEVTSGNGGGVCTVPTDTNYNVSPCSGRCNNGYVNYSTCTPDGAAPFITMKIIPNGGKPGVNPLISWSAAGNPTSCWATGDWSGTKPTGGTDVPLGPLNTVGYYSYTLTCRNGYGYGTNTKTVNVFLINTTNPDLIAGATTPSSATTNVPVTFSSTIMNDGIAYWGTAGNGFQINSAVKGTGTTTVYVSLGGIPPIRAGQTVPISTTYTFTQAKTYSVRSYVNGVFDPPGNTTNGPWTNVVVTDAPLSFDYSLSNSGTTNVIRGGSGQNTITETLLSGTSQPVTLSVSGAPAGVSTTPSSCFPANPTCTSVITFTVQASVPAGDYNITVNGSPKGKTTSFILRVANNPAIAVACTASPSSVLVGQTVTWTANASGGTPPYTYSWSGPGLPDPAPSSASFGITYSTIGQKTAQVVVTDSLSSTGSCPAPGGTVQINFNPQFKEF